jgi:NAD+ synthase
MSNLADKYRRDVIDIDYETAADSICDYMRRAMREDLHRRGAVVAVSGGIDSSLCAALSVKAFGSKRTYLLKLPESDSADDTQSRSTQLIALLGSEHTTFDISSTLDAIGCYAARDEAIRRLFPDYTSEWKNKITIEGGIEGKINHFALVVQKPDNSIMKKTLDVKSYLQIVAATNYKQRVRKTVEYFHADRLNYAVIGTPNLLEYDQGFFVKNGDGSADLKPIAHLYKTQVYLMARQLGLPESICDAEPTTDTYSMPQGQDEFYFALPYKQMDMALWAYNQNASTAELAEMIDITEEQAKYIYSDIETKRRTTAYLHKSPIRLD